MANHKAHDGSPAGLRPQGVALVITLIMLSIITVVTVTILAIARRDRAAVTQAANLTDSRLAADAGQERAKAEIVAQILRSSALMGYDLTVSRSFATNVTELFIDPRVPVFPAGMTVYEQTNGGRFFLDVNRNRLFEDTVVSNGAVLAAGDPQWIGLLEKPYRKHDGNNRFVGRYAFLVVPSGKTLDLNWIHNLGSSSAAGLRYTRNQGFGPWELNLAAFLADLAPPPPAPSIWSGLVGYSFDPLPLPNARGFAFVDALSILNYRFTTNNPLYLPLPSIATLYGPNASIAFQSDLIDGYCHGPLMGAAYLAGRLR